MLKMIAAIVPSGQGESASLAARSAGAPGGTIIPAQGAAPNSVLSLLGFGDNTKEILLSVVPASAEQKIHDAIQDDCQKMKGKGAIFSVNVTSFIKSGSKGNSFSEENFMEQNEGFQMINIIVNKGYAEDAMAAARSAGAGGGTILNGRGTAKEGDDKFFGVEIVPEKELLMVVAPNKKARAIIESVQSLPCFSKDGSGVVFTADASSFALLGKK